MLHMLGRFVFISSFSRRSRSGFRMGSTRFGFCCCERGLLSVFTILISIHPSFAIQSCRLGCSLRPSQHPEPNGSLAMFLGTHMGPPSPRSERCQFGGPVVSVSCSIATVTRRQIAAPA